MKWKGYSRGYKFKPGDRVRSHFRAQWTGVILGYCDGKNGPTHCVRVRLVLDRNGRAMSKPNSDRNIHVLSGGWLELLVDGAAA